MGKRSDFKRIERDFYPTPYEGVIPLIPHLPDTFDFIEPCAGNGILVRHLEKHGGNCILKSDIEPQSIDIKKMDIFDISTNGKLVITNPPWDRKILHPMISHFIECNSEAWLLFDADWAHTKQSSIYMEHCEKIVSVGRLKWIPDSKMTGKDNCAWYKFVPNPTKTEFIRRH